MSSAGGTGQTRNAAILLRIREESAEGFAQRWIGTMLWIQPSPLRPHHPRKNWSAGITEVRFDSGEGLLRRSDFRVETRRASGHVGQHLNKTDSAVRIPHLPTCESAAASEERSEMKNRETAYLRLIRKLRKRGRKRESEGRQTRRHDHHTLIRGSPLRIFKGNPLKEFFPSHGSLFPNRKRFFCILRFGEKPQTSFPKVHLPAFPIFSQKIFFER